MKRVLKFLGYGLLSLLALLLLAVIVFQIRWSLQGGKTMKLAGEPAPRLEESGYAFRDLNKNGRLDPYEDGRVPVAARIDDLLSQMTVAEKAGSMLLHFAVMGTDGEIPTKPSLTNPFSWLIDNPAHLLLEKNMHHFGLFGEATSAAAFAAFNNRLQELAERTRLGIPVTLVSDPRHGSTDMAGASNTTKWLSTWPSQLGLAATRDSALVQEFGDIARREYLGIGIRLALHPMADLATEPRWARVNGTFGEDAALSAKLTAAYIRGFQGDSLDRNSIACQTKHFAGGGPQEDGWDAHFASGKGQVYPGDRFDYHLIPFTEGAFPAGTAQVMPYYGIPKGQVTEEVGFAFSKEMIQELLRDSLGYDGVVATDWGIISDLPVKTASAWGVEELTPQQRMVKVLDAGCDMFGGEKNNQYLVELVANGDLSEARLDASLRRVFRDKFRLGLFDDPYVDPALTAEVGNTDFIAKGKEAQRRSLVLLKNEGLLPLAANQKIFLYGFASDLSARFPQITDDPAAADVIVQRLPTPSTPPPSGADLLERLIPQGRLDFPAEELAKILARTQDKPTVTILTLQRPSVVPEIDASSRAMIADFECEEDILLELITGKFRPSGKLPVELP
ncbi:MAG: glycoside hydrolase family 3 N-terminal domain-containing protein, partial [Bacteroidota bacterium]